MSGLAAAVVGLGLGRHHVAAYLESPAVERLVICDTDPRALLAIHAAYPEVAADYEDLERMLDAETPDVVSIVTPDHLHRPHAEACLAAGAHVLLTKPLATNLEDGRAIVRSAEAAGRKLMVAHERRYRSRHRQLKALLEGGELGDVIYVRADAIQDKRRQFARSPWYASAEAGRTALVGSGIHEVDLVRYLVGQPVVSVEALSNTLGELSFPGPKTTAALFRFADGVIGQVTVTYVAHQLSGGPQNADFRLVATQGTVVGRRVSLDGAESWTELPDDPQAIVTGTFGCVRQFLDAVLANRPVPIDGREAFASLAAAVAADVSAATGRAVAPETADFD